MDPGFRRAVRGEGQSAGCEAIEELLTGPAAAEFGQDCDIRSVGENGLDQALDPRATTLLHVERHDSHSAPASPPYRHRPASSP